MTDLEKFEEALQKMADRISGIRKMPEAEKNSQLENEVLVIENAAFFIGEGDMVTGFNLLAGRPIGADRNVS